LESFLNLKTLNILGHELNEDDIKVSFAFDKNKQNSAENWETANGGNSCVVMLNTAEDESLVSQGLAREVISRVQKLRKEVLVKFIFE
jgi:hypothetical protein